MRKLLGVGAWLLLLVGFLGIMHWIVQNSNRLEQPTDPLRGFVLSDPVSVFAEQSFNVKCGAESIGPLTVGVHSTGPDTEALYMMRANDIKYGRIQGTYTDLIQHDRKIVAVIYLDTPSNGAIAQGIDGCDIQKVTPSPTVSTD